jgi:hypothetical protein
LCTLALATALGTLLVSASGPSCEVPKESSKCIRYVVFDVSDKSPAAAATQGIDVVGFIRRRRVEAGPSRTLRSGVSIDSIDGDVWLQQDLSGDGTVIGLSEPVSTKARLSASDVREVVAMAAAEKGATVVVQDLDEEERRIEETIADAPAEPALCTNPEDGSPADSGWSLLHVNARPAWQRFESMGGRPGDSVVIGYLDTGYTDHPALSVQSLSVLDGFDFRSCRCSAFDPRTGPQGPMGFYEPGHGTGPASVIIGKANADKPGPGAVRGLAPYATLMPMRAVRGVIIGPGRAAVLGAAIRSSLGRYSRTLDKDAWCAACEAGRLGREGWHRDDGAGSKTGSLTGKPPDVLSMSLGGLLRELAPGYSPTREQILAIMKGIRVLHEAIREAERDGVIVVAAAGQTGEAWPIPIITKLIKGNWSTAQPASWAETIGAAGTKRDAMPWEVSFRGSTIDISAPARGVWAAKWKGPEKDAAVVCTGKGTTYAAALTASTAALWLDYHRKKGRDLREIYGPALMSAYRLVLDPTNLDAKRPLGQRGYRSRDEICAASVGWSSANYWGTNPAYWGSDGWVPSGAVWKGDDECTPKEDGAWQSAADGGYGPGILDVDGVLTTTLPSLRAVCRNEVLLDERRRRHEQDQRGDAAIAGLFKDRCHPFRDCDSCSDATP